MADNPLPGTDLRQKAQELAEHFLKYDTEYQLGFLDAEQANPLTRGLGEAARRDPAAAVGMILKVDLALADCLEKVMQGDAYREFRDAVCGTIRRGGRIVFSGCGATGRLALNLEASWRRALQSLSEKRMIGRQILERMEKQVIALMTGGDYALIKSVESFEDYARLGREQVRQAGIGPGDLLTGITATGETTSILGTALEALEQGADVEMVICSDWHRAAEKLQRAAEVYGHPRVHTVMIPCGAMAVTGSTRMQSSTAEQLICAAALQDAMNELCGLPPVLSWPSAFRDAVLTLSEPRSEEVLAGHASREAALYAGGSRLCYFAEEYLLDVLSDTTERSPTFMVPPFLPEGAEGIPSWAFVKDPSCPTAEAWLRCLMHPPRCIEWTQEDYQRFGTPLQKIPQITAADLYRFRIGYEPDPDRENAGDSLAVWIGENSSSEAFVRAASRYRETASLSLEELDVLPASSPMKVIGHLAVKIMMNTVSTVTMGIMGRLTSNYMTWMDMSNKKLVDRSARLIVQECGVPYPQALEELYLSRLLLDEAKTNGSPVHNTIQRLKNNGLGT